MNAKPSFRPVPCHGGWQILVTWPDARTEQLSGYSSEAEAVKWINNLSDSMNRIRGQVKEDGRPPVHIRLAGCHVPANKRPSLTAS